MISEISSFFTSIREIIDIAKGYDTLRKRAEIYEHLAPLLGRLLAIESDAVTVYSLIQRLQEENEAYRKKLVEFENWVETDSQHELREVMPGIRARVKKGLEDKAVQGSHWYCANCWSDRIQSPLQLKNSNQYVVSYYCPRCKSVFSHWLPKRERQPGSKAWT